MLTSPRAVCTGGTILLSRRRQVDVPEAGVSHVVVVSMMSLSATLARLSMSVSID